MLALWKIFQKNKKQGEKKRKVNFFLHFLQKH